MESRMENQPHLRHIPMVWIALLAMGAAGGCADSDPRIIASFRQGEDTFNYSPKLGRANYYYNPPTVVGDHVYIGTSRRLHDAPGPDNFFFKLDNNLKKVWEYPLGYDEVRGGAALDAEGRIYFVVERGRKLGDASMVEDFLFCLSNDGKFQWQFLIASPVSASQAASVHYNDVGMFNPAIAANGTIYVGGSKFYALSSSGEKVWEYPASRYFDGGMKNAPIIDPEGNIYFLASGLLLCLRPDGTERWLAYGGDAWSSPAFSFDYTRVYAATVRTVHCFDTATGATIWSFTPPGISGDFRATPAVDDAGNVYLGTKADSAGTFYAIKADGTLLWENHMGADLYSSPALGNDRTIYVGSEYTGSERRFHALDMASGAKKWSVRFPGMGDVTWSSPALVDGGVIYVGSMNGNVYAIRSDATGLLPNAGSARFHEGNASTGRRE